MATHGDRPRPAVFLDRDGTLIEEVHYLSDPARLRLLPGAGGAVRGLRAAGFACVVVTNQSAVGRGMITESRLHEIHAEMHRQLAAEDAAVDGLYFCPEAPAAGEDEATVDARSDRKPGAGMILRAARELGLDLPASWSVGDMLRDLQAGHNAGCPGLVLVQTGKGSTQIEAAAASGLTHHVAADLAAAADLILARSAPARGQVASFGDDPRGQVASFGDDPRGQVASFGDDARSESGSFGHAPERPQG